MVIHLVDGGGLPDGKYDGVGASWARLVGVDMVLGVDLDGVCADFTSAYAAKLIAVEGADPIPNEWHATGRLQVPQWHWEELAGFSPATVATVWHQILNSETFWAELEPCPGVDKALQMLGFLSWSGYQIYFLTHRMGRKAKLQSEHWLFEHGKIAFPTVVLTGPDKLPIIQALDIGFYIDDKLETMNALQPLATDRYFFLHDAPYNQDGRETSLDVVGSLQDALERVGLWATTKSS